MDSSLTFSGDSDSNVRKWLKQIEFAAKYNRPSEATFPSMCIDMIFFHATNLAEDFLSSDPVCSKFADLDVSEQTLDVKKSLFSILEKRFGSVTSMENPFDRIKELSQTRSDKTIKKPEAYYTEALGLISRLGCSDELLKDDPWKNHLLSETVKYFVDGISDMNIQLDVARQTPSTLSEAFSQLRKSSKFWSEYGHKIRSSNPPLGPVPSLMAFPPSKSQFQQPTSQTPASLPAPSRNSQSTSAPASSQVYPPPAPAPTNTPSVRAPDARSPEIFNSLPAHLQKLLTDNGGGNLCVNCGDPSHVARDCKSVTRFSRDESNFLRAYFGLQYAPSSGYGPRGKYQPPQRVAQSAFSMIEDPYDDTQSQDFEQGQLMNSESSGQREANSLSSSLEAERNKRAHESSDDARTYRQTSRQAPPRQERPEPVHSVPTAPPNADFTFNAPTPNVNPNVSSRQNDDARPTKGMPPKRMGVKRSLAPIRAMTGVQPFDVGQYLQHTKVDMTVAQLLQISPFFRTELSRLQGNLNPRKTKKKSRPADVRHVHFTAGDASSLSVSTYIARCDVGSFYVSGRARCNGDNDQWHTLDNSIIIDAGSQCNLVTHDTLRLLGLVPNSLARSNDGNCVAMRTSSGDRVEFDGWCDIVVNVGGYRSIQQMYVVPTISKASRGNGVGYSILLGIPWLSMCYAVVDVSEMSISLRANTGSGGRIVLSGKEYHPQIPLREKYTTVNRYGKFVNIEPFCDESSEENDVDGNDSDHDVDDEADDETSSSDYTPASDVLNSRRIELTSFSSEDDSKLSRQSLSYVPASSYVAAYGDSGDLSFIAQSCASQLFHLESEDGSVVEEAEIFLLDNELPLAKNSECNSAILPDIDDPSSYHYINRESHPFGDGNFPTQRRPVYRDLDIASCPPFNELKDWQSRMGFQIGPVADTPEKVHRMLSILWTWRDVHREHDSDLTVTDLVEYRLVLREDAIPHATPGARRLSDADQKFLYDTCRTALADGRVERIDLSKESISRWRAPPVIVYKKAPTDEHGNPVLDPETGKPVVSRRLTFNYRNVKKAEIVPANQLQFVSAVHDIMKNPEHVTYGEADCKSAYWCIPVAKVSRPILEFYVPGLGKLRPTVAPQGCPGSGMILAEAADRTFGPIPEPSAEEALFGKNFGVYQDDQKWAFATFEEEAHFLMYRFFPRLHWSRFGTSFRKFKCCCDSITGLGISVRAGGFVTVLNSRIDKILNFPEITNKTEALSFIGIVQVTHHHVKNLTEMLVPIQAMGSRKKGVSFEMTPAEKRSFEMVKQAVSEAVQLRGYSDTLPVCMYTDASANGGGIVLTQSFAGEEPHVILYDSFAFSAAEKNYATFKAELCVGVWAYTKYKYLFNVHLDNVWFTDHRPLLGFLGAGSLHVGIYARWAILLTEAPLRVEHISGKLNKAADGLSRTIFPEYSKDSIIDHVGSLDPQLGEFKAPVGPLMQSMSSSLHGPIELPEVYISGSVAFLDLEDRFAFSDNPYADETRVTTLSCQRSELFLNVPIIQNYRESPWYSDIYLFLSEFIVPDRIEFDKCLVKHFKSNAAKFMISSDGVLLRRVGKQSPEAVYSICIPEDEVNSVLFDVHDRAGHYGSKQLQSKLFKRVWWPSLVSDCDLYVRTCITCAKTAHKPPSTSLLQSLTWSPFQLLGIDFIGPLPATPRGHRYILHVCDYFSRFTRAYSSVTDNRHDVISALSEFCSTYRVPNAIYADNGSHFSNADFKSWCLSRNIQLIFAPKGSSQSAGMVERHNGILIDTLKKTTGNDYLNWDQYLVTASSFLNSRVMSLVGFSPLEIVFGVDPFSVESLNSLSLDQRESLFMSSFSCSESEWKDRVDFHAFQREETQRSLADSKSSSIEATGPVTFRTFDVGDLVYLWDTSRDSGEKFRDRFTGPYEVTSKARKSYRLRHVLSAKVIPGSFHVDHLKLFVARPQRLRTGNEPFTFPKLSVTTHRGRRL